MLKRKIFIKKVKVNNKKIFINFLKKKHINITLLFVSMAGLQGNGGRRRRRNQGKGKANVILNLMS